MLLSGLASPPINYYLQSCAILNDMLEIIYYVFLHRIQSILLSNGAFICLCPGLEDSLPLFITLNPLRTIGWLCGRVPDIVGKFDSLCAI